mmetsp:Transcript_13925/g.26693  ORF Transcript_13925/g.26693 Transcript_13925/m.26693 type:complete len:335 (+) Transcript_13925:152-1156(+)
MQQSTVSAIIGFLTGAVFTHVVWSMWNDLQGQTVGGADLLKPAKGISLKSITTVPPSQLPRSPPPSPTFPPADAKIPVDGERLPLNFMHTPDAFVDTFESCETDTNCKVIFHHVYKTGGTTLEKTMANIWHQPHSNSCCNEQRMRNFFSNRDYYCGNKFSSHQVNATDFFRAVTACYPTEANLSSSRLVLLTTFREPNQMLLSQIHQMCNKNYFRRPQHIIDTCKACDYNNGTEVWDGMIQEVNDQLQGSWQVSRVFLGSLNTSVSLPADTTILTLESSDITAFFERYKPDLKLKQANRERLDVCEFRITSEMARKLRSAQFFYRQLVANIDYH